jgi:hypothetical protein
VISVQEAVKEVVKVSPFIQEALSRGIINLSAFARKIHPEVEALVKKEIKVGAIIVALKRFAIELRRNDVGKINFLRQIGDLTVRSNLTEFTFAFLTTDVLLAKQNELLTRIKDEKDTFCTISQGVVETTIIVSKNVEEIVEAIFEDDKFVSNFRNLASITIKLPKETVDTAGAYYTILALLAWEGINVVEVVSTYSELTVIFRDEDVDKAFSTLKRAFRT